MARDPGPRQGVGNTHKGAKEAARPERQLKVMAGAEQGDVRGFQVLLLDQYWCPSTRSAARSAALAGCDFGCFRACFCFQTRGADLLGERRRAGAH